MATFNVAVERLLEKEGGYVNHPDDPGKETNFGISKRRYPELDIRTLTREQAVALYQRDFWNPLYDRIETQAIGVKLLELTVHLPHGDDRPYYETDMKGIRLLQQALHVLGHTVEVDGIFGPQTLMAVRLMNAAALVEAIKVQQVKHYTALVATNQSLRPFLLGWMKRAVASVASVVCIASMAGAGGPGRGRGVEGYGGVESVPLVPLYLSTPSSVPRCRGGEIGFWQPLVDSERKKVGMVLTTIDRLTPRAVLCRLGSTQRVQALPPEVEL